MLSFFRPICNANDGECINTNKKIVMVIKTRLAEYIHDLLTGCSVFELSVIATTATDKFTRMAYASVSPKKIMNACTWRTPNVAAAREWKSTEINENFNQWRIVLVWKHTSMRPIRSNNFIFILPIFATFRLRRCEHRYFCQWTKISIQ